MCPKLNSSYLLNTSNMDSSLLSLTFTPPLIYIKTNGNLYYYPLEFVDVDNLTFPSETLIYNILSLKSIFSVGHTRRKYRYFFFSDSRVRHSIDDWFNLQFSPRSAVLVLTWLLLKTNFQKLIYATTKPL